MKWLLLSVCCLLGGCASAPPVVSARQPVMLSQETPSVLLGFWDGRWAVGSWWNDFSLDIQHVENGRIKGVWSAQGTPLGDKALNQPFDDVYAVDSQGRLLWTPKQFPAQQWVIQLSQQDGRRFLSWQAPLKDDVFEVELIQKPSKPLKELR